MIVLMLGGNHDLSVGGDGSFGKIDVTGDQAIRLRECGTVRGGVVHGDAETRQAA